MNNRKKSSFLTRFVPVLLATLCLAVLLSFPLLAEEEGRIELSFKHENTEITGAEFFLYRVAEWKNGGYVLTGEFADYPILLPDENDGEEWMAAASTLAAYTLSDDPTAVGHGLTDELGRVSWEGLADGLYLAVGRPVTVGETLFLPQPMLIPIPYEGEEREPTRDIVAEVKYDFREPEGKTLERRVLKVWENNGQDKKQPKSITVVLLCDGEPYDEQTLGPDNNWRYVWEELDASHDWQIIEKDVPDGYTVKVEREGVTFVMTNTHEPPPPSSTTTGKDTEPDLPQTGMLWWPVPILLGGGILFMGVGIYAVCSKKGKRDE